MSFRVVIRGALPLLLVALAGCRSIPSGPAAPEPVAVVSDAARQAEAERVDWLQAHPDWSFQGRVAVTRGRDGGSGRIDWQQHGQRYVAELSAPVTRQSWRLEGDGTGGGRLDGLSGGPRGGSDAQLLLREASGWEIPVNQLGDWVRGLVEEGRAHVGYDAEGRPRTISQQDWTIQYQEWLPAQDGRPALPRRIEAASGDARVRLVLDQWQFGQP